MPRATTEGCSQRYPRLRVDDAPHIILELHRLCHTLYSVTCRQPQDAADTTLLSTFELSNSALNALLKSLASSLFGHQLPAAVSRLLDLSVLLRLVGRARLRKVLVYVHQNKASAPTYCYNTGDLCVRMRARCRSLEGP